MSQATLSQDRYGSSTRGWFGHWRFCVAMLVLSTLVNSDAGAADEGFSLGDPLPAFSKLVAVDHTECSTDQFTKSKVLIIAFTCNRCPYAVDYEERLNLLHKRYGDSRSPVSLLVIKGALDDTTNADDVKIHYVNDAVAAVLAGTPIKTAEAGARGCTIRFKRRRPVGRKP